MKNVLLIFLSFMFTLSFVNAQEWNSEATNTLYAENASNTVNPIRVGIGTSSPSANLHTVGRLRFQNVQQNQNINRILGTLSNGNVRWISKSDLNSNDWHLTGNTANNTAFIGTLNSESFKFRTNDTQRMEIEAAGRVKIMANDQTVFGGQSLLNVYTNSSASYDTTSAFDGIYLFNESTDTSSAKGVSIRMGARRGAAPNWHGTAAISGVISSDANGGDVTDAMDIVFQNEFASPAVLQENMRITNQENVGIGTRTPQAQLHTTGTVQFDGLLNGSGQYLALNSNNQLVLTNCSCPLNSLENEGSSDEIKDLKERITELENLVREQLNIQPETTSKATSHVLSAGTLSQNAPNPFNHSTMISYSVPQDVQTAKLIITDLKGQTMKEIRIKERGKGQLELLNNEMESGFYAYSLLLDDRVIDTKKMIIAK